MNTNFIYKILFLNIFGLGIAHYYQDQYVYIFHIVSSISNICLSLFFFRTLDKEKCKDRYLLLCIQILYFYSIIIAVYHLFIERYYTFANINDIISIIFISLVLAYVVFELNYLYNKKTNLYDKKNVYLVYQKPITWLDTIKCIIIPSSKNVRFVIGGYEYDVDLNERSILQRIEHIPSNKYIYKKVEDYQHVERKFTKQSQCY